MQPNTSPCKGCEDRQTACWDKCAKYAQWKADCQKIKDTEKEYKRQRREDYIRSEQCEAEKYNYARRKPRWNSWRE